MQFHIVLTEQDADIICFKRSLPKGKFNETVIKIMRAAVRNKIAVMPMNFKIVRSVTKLNTKIDLPEDLIQKCYEKLGFKKGGFTTGVKAGIRKCIRKNLVVKRERLSIAETQKLFEAATEMMNKQRGGSPSLAPYREAVDFLIHEIQKAMDGGET